MITIQTIVRGTALIAILLLSACQRDPGRRSAEPSGITDSQFVSLYVELWQARTKASTSEEYEAQKKQILEQAKVSERALQLFAREHANDIPFMAAVWDSVQNRLNAPGAAPQPE